MGGGAQGMLKEAGQKGTCCCWHCSGKNCSEVSYCLAICKAHGVAAAGFFHLLEVQEQCLAGSGQCSCVASSAQG